VGVPGTACTEEKERSERVVESSTNPKGEHVEENETGASVEMPKYRSHKTVWALKIAAVDDPTKPGDETDGSRVLTFTEPHYAPKRVPHAFVRKHDPKAGGYYVVYEDGYASWSPADAFETGYTRIP
jgi:hypothetical protein